MAYKLELTEEDMSTIGFVGRRYCWSAALDEHCNEGLNEIPEHIAWELQESFDMDREGGHSYFPMLDYNSELAVKLFKFMDSIV